MTHLACSALQVGGKLGTSASQATSNNPVIKSVVHALQTLLDQGESLFPVG